eukprot:352404-Chlamydomonas_euryale.AAC.1
MSSRKAHCRQTCHVGACTSTSCRGGAPPRQLETTHLPLSPFMQAAAQAAPHANAHRACRRRYISVVCRDSRRDRRRGERWRKGRHNRRRRAATSFEGEDRRSRAQGMP